MTNRQPIYGLDLIRFASAMMVVAWHLAYRFFDDGAEHIRQFAASLPAGPNPVQGLGLYGWVGVQVFFVISGLVISYSAQGSSARKFFTGRVGRLWPGVAICTALIVVIDLGYWHLDPWTVTKATIKSLVIWPTGGWIAPQFWSLPVEMSFYALVWLMIWRGGVRHLDWLAALLTLVSAVYWALSYAHAFEPSFPLHSVLLLQHGMYFAIGICLSSIDRDGFTLTRVAVPAVAVPLGVAEIAQSVHKYGVYSDAEPARWLLAATVWIAMLALIIASLANKNRIAVLVNWWKVGGVSRALGLATYPLYLIHVHVGGFVASAAFARGVAPAVAVSLGAAACVPMAMAIALALEPPLRRRVEEVIGRIPLPKRFATT